MSGLHNDFACMPLTATVGALANHFGYSPSGMWLDTRIRLCITRVHMMAGLLMSNTHAAQVNRLAGVARFPHAGD